MKRCMWTWRAAGAAAYLLLIAAAAQAAGADEFRIKREPVFAFARKPIVTREGDRVTIEFETQGFCDVTVAIEEAGENGVRPPDAEGSDPFFRPRIVRHLASGVLGPNAPEPFQKNSKKQVLVWDSKNDKGEYLDDKEALTVRVSLGLKPQFERTLYWSPKKRSHADVPAMAATAEGVYVFDGQVIDHVRLFDHEGNYVRTVYPFPAERLSAVQGLHWRRFPQDGANWPMKEGFHQSTLLSSGTNAGFDEKLGIGIDVHNNWHGAVSGNAATFLTVHSDRLALGRLKLNRLATDGSTGGLDLTGPDVSFPILPMGNVNRGERVPVPPRSAAFSPDGRYLYLTGYVYGHGQTASRDIILVKYYDWLPGVARLDYAAGAKAKVFAGSMDVSRHGTDSSHFRTPTSVAVDAQGRVYVSDCVNHRVQVFSPEGRFLKSIEADYPSRVAIHHQTQEIYVFSWAVPNTFGDKGPSREERQYGARPRKRAADFEPQLTVLKSFDDPTPVLACALPLGAAGGRGTGFSYRAELDSWTDPPTIWTGAEWGRLDIMTRDKIRYSNLRLYALVDGELRLKRDFERDVQRAVVRTSVPVYHRQRLFVSPVTGRLYIAEGEGASGKSFKQLVTVDPDSGKVALQGIPFDAEDMAFDADGLAYLRTFYLVARYDPETWKEVPFDYGESHEKVHTSSSSDRRVAAAASVIRLPTSHAGLHHHGGMNVSVNGNLIIAVNNHTEVATRRDLYDEIPQKVGDYVPTAFPGRVRWGEIHVFDRYGRFLFEDAVPGLGRTDGLGLDKDHHIYALSTATRLMDGTRYFNDMTGTLVKFPAGRAKVLSPSDGAVVPLSGGSRPDRAPDFANGQLGRAWATGALWFYGAVGFAGKNAARAGGGCDCHNARFALDYFARSFAPEVDHYSVAVLDTNGNLILRLGRYGNVDDGRPLVAQGGPPTTRAIGGDEVALFHAPYLATQTDHRLFIADPGNARILSVRLDYHATDRIALKDVKESG